MGLAQCLDGTGAPVAFVQDVAFDVTQLDTTSLGVAFSVGFIIVGTCWVIGKATGTVMKAIKRL
jgi:hypothetical protein